MLISHKYKYLIQTHFFQMKNIHFTRLTDAQLITKRTLLKGISIGFGIIYLTAILFMIYLFSTTGFQKISITTFIPFLTIPITFVPLVLSLKSLNKEIHSRKV